MKELSVLMKPASSLCNLRCRYCFYADVSENREQASLGVMKDETIDIVASRIREALEENGTANISFQGGEPTVAGLEWFRKFAAAMDRYPDIRVNWSMQTNATLLDEAFCAFLAERKFLVGVSLDGYQANHDHFRYDAKNKGAFYRVLHGIDLLKKAGVDYNILTVVTSDLSKHAKALYQFYVQHHFEYVQLIPCLPGLDGEWDGLAIRPEEYEVFYKEFFACWAEGFAKGVSLSVNLFENLAGMLRGYPPYQCGMLGRCVVQYVIEGDGTVYPCDFYCLDEYCLGNLKDLGFEEMKQTQHARDFLSGSDCRKTPCETCRYVRMCSGGCRRQNICYLKDDYCAYQKVLDEILPVLDRILRQYQEK